ncbi:MAG: DUF305 domain-containing protein [Erythrobacter sp.]
MKNSVFVLPAFALLAVGGLTACGAENAEPAATMHGGMDHSQHTASAQDQNDAQRAYAEVNDRMHEGMSQIDADADVAFMEGMLAHHRGAVEMSEVELQYGSDEQARDLAQRIIDAQQAEIEEMEVWLADRTATGD